MPQRRISAIVHQTRAPCTGQSGIDSWRRAPEHRRGDLGAACAVRLAVVLGTGEDAVPHFTGRLAEDRSARRRPRMRRTASCCAKVVARAIARGRRRDDRVRRRGLRQRVEISSSGRREPS